MARSGEEAALIGQLLARGLLLAIGGLLLQLLAELVPMFLDVLPEVLRQVLGVGIERIARLANQQLVRHLRLVEPDAEARAIGRLLSDRVVVNLPVDVLAGWNALADVGAVRVDAASGHPGQQLVRARQRR